MCLTTKDGEAREIKMCPTEGRRRRFYTYFEFWYGWTLHCLGCGDEWADGERRPRPFYRYWKRDAIERHKREWAECVPHEPDWKAFMAQFEEATA